MRLALRDSFPVEVRHLLDEVVILQQYRTVGTDCERVLIAWDWNPASVVVGLLPSFFMTAPPLSRLAIWSETQASGNSFASDQSLSKGCRTVLLARLKLNAETFLPGIDFQKLNALPPSPKRLINISCLQRPW